MYMFVYFRIQQLTYATTLIPFVYKYKEGQNCHSVPQFLPNQNTFSTFGPLTWICSFERTGWWIKGVPLPFSSPNWPAVSCSDIPTFSPHSVEDKLSSNLGRTVHSGGREREPQGDPCSAHSAFHMDVGRLKRCKGQTLEWVWSIKSTKVCNNCQGAGPEALGDLKWVVMHLSKRCWEWEVQDPES